MLTHSQIWHAIDALASRHGLSPSGLAKLAGLDPTTFNKSKRAAGGKLRWPSTESVAKALKAGGAGDQRAACGSSNPNRRRNARRPGSESSSDARPGDLRNTRSASLCPRLRVATVWNGRGPRCRRPGPPGGRSLFAFIPPIQPEPGPPPPGVGPAKAPRPALPARPRRHTREGNSANIASAA